MTNTMINDIKNQISAFDREIEEIKADKAKVMKGLGFEAPGLCLGEIRDRLIKLDADIYDIGLEKRDAQIRLRKLMA